MSSVHLTCHLATCRLRHVYPPGIWLVTWSPAVCLMSFLPTFDCSPAICLMSVLPTSDWSPGHLPSVSCLSSWHLTCHLVTCRLSHACRPDIWLVTWSPAVCLMSVLLTSDWSPGHLPSVSCLSSRHLTGHLVTCSLFHVCPPDIWLVTWSPAVCLMSFLPASDWSPAVCLMSFLPASDWSPAICLMSVHPASDWSPGHLPSASCLSTYLPSIRLVSVSSSFMLLYLHGNHQACYGHSLQPCLKTDSPTRCLRRGARDLLSVVLLLVIIRRSE